MSSTSNIFLVGPMGSGKTAVGKRLAQELEMDFYDSDHVVEERTGVDIPYIFEREGEAGFRQREAAVIEELAALNGVVVATGGGTPVDSLSRKLLSENGQVIYLHTTVPEQLRRTGKSAQRPLLRGKDRRKVLQDLMDMRDPIYREIADMIVDTDGKHVNAVVRHIKTKLIA